MASRKDLTDIMSTIRLYPVLHTPVGGQEEFYGFQAQLDYGDELEIKIIRGPFAEALIRELINDQE